MTIFTTYSGSACSKHAIGITECDPNEVFLSDQSFHLRGAINRLESLIGHWLELVVSSDCVRSEKFRRLIGFNSCLQGSFGDGALLNLGDSLRNTLAASERPSFLRGPIIGLDKMMQKFWTSKSWDVFVFAEKK